MANYLDGAGLADLWGIVGGCFNNLGNEHIWAKQGTEPYYTGSVELGSTASQDNRYFYVGATLTFGTGYSFDTSTGDIVIENPTTIIVEATDDCVSALNTAMSNGGIAYTKNKFYNNMLRAEAGTPALFEFSGTVYTNDANALRANVSYTMYTITVTESVKTSLLGYLNSPNADAYPPAVDDGYTYTYLGQLGNKVQIATGSYTGDGSGVYDLTARRKIELGFAPKAVMIFRQDGTVGQNGNICGGLFLPNAPLRGTDTTDWGIAAHIDGTGFRVNEGSSRNVYLNSTDKVYYYIVIY